MGRAVDSEDVVMAKIRQKLKRMLRQRKPERWANDQC
jgi:hypothetical protein